MRKTLNVNYGIKREKCYKSMLPLEDCREISGIT